MDKNRPFRITPKKFSWASWETRGRWVWPYIFIRFMTWGFRRFGKPLFYHPIALGGIAVYTFAYFVSPWLACALLWGVLTWQRFWPYSYLQHAQPRVDSFFAGFKYRHRPRRKLTANGLLNDQDPVPTISTVSKTGCITRVRIKMSHGDDINYWRERSSRIAQTYGALSCKIDPYRREELLPWRHTMITKPRWAVLEFLTRDPFSTGLGVEYINSYRQPDTFTPVVAVSQNGEPEHDDLAAHKLAVAMTQWGKSTRIRAKIYAYRDKIRKGELELWGIDGKGGIEQSFMEHVFARVAYGDTELNPNAYHPAEFDKLLKDAVLVLKRRQRRMRGNTTHHTPTPKEPWLLIVIDEILVLTSKSLSPELRTSIAASINLIFQQGLACAVSIDASTQLGKKDKLDPIDRDGFTEFELGKVERGVVDMIFGTGWWERGARADEIADDLKGAFYKKTDNTMAPKLIRYPGVGVADVTPRALGFRVGESVLWKPQRILRPVEDPPVDDDEELESAAMPNSSGGGFGVG